MNNQIKYSGIRIADCEAFGDATCPGISRFSSTTGQSRLKDLEYHAANRVRVLLPRKMVSVSLTNTGYFGQQTATG